jgi:protein PhnA
MSDLPPCPKCRSEYAYADGAMLICPECAHEWSPGEASTDAPGAAGVRDSVGNPLADGDSVTLIKDLKVKGTSTTLKVGTKVRNIRLDVSGDDHDIDCKVDGVGAMKLKSAFVKKA